ncbi:MAG: FprA family A-type flavoprotein [Synergistaceae bacterium]|jgi:flavorubredoxin|nr:FprA family A-type flavoprotein [Synergistaceae bacterium]
MHKAIPVTKDTFWVGVNDYETDLFESLWPLPQGVAYNAYVVLGDKTAAIDTVKGPKFDDYLDKVAEALAGRPLDYLVVNHMEPDHAGLTAELKRAHPGLKIVGNPKTIPLLKGYHRIEEDIVQVKDGEKLDIGGHELFFYTIPMVHWPESMVTYDAVTKTLFSNDAFGGFGAHEGGVFDDEKPRSRWEGEMLRYYAAIVARYSNLVQGALKKLKGLEIANIYPAHGTLFRTDIGQVVDLYDRWSRHETERGVVVAYGSMYGNTRRMAEAVCGGICEGGVKNVHLYDASRSDMSMILRDIWRYKGLALLSCTYNTVLFPTMAALCEKLINRMPKNRLLGIAGSYSWSKGALAALRTFADAVKLEKIEPEVEVFAAPTLADLERCAELGRNMAKAVAAPEVGT